MHRNKGRKVVIMTNTSKMKLQYYQIKSGEDLVAQLGSAGIREYGLDRFGKETEHNHYHNLLEIAVCRQGTGTFIFEEKRIPYSEGAIAIIPANYPHNVISTSGEKSFWESVYINPNEFLKEYFEKREVEKLIKKINMRAIFQKKEEIPLFSRELDCLMDQIRMKDYGYKNCVKGLIFTLLMEIVKINAQDYWIDEPEKKIDRDKLEKLKQALAYVDENYAEEIKVGDIAEASYISESYLRKIFAENYNMTPVQYVNFVRINHACKILQREAISVNDVARKVGFDNMSTFIKNFKKITGKTPKIWAKDNRLNHNIAQK